MTSPLNSKDTDDGRYYVWNDEQFLSVTNILEKTKNKPALLPWGVKLTAEAAWETIEYLQAHKGQVPPKPKLQRIVKGNPVMKEVDWPTYWKAQHRKAKDESAERGSIIHDWAERFALGQEPPPPAGLEQECMGIIAAFEKYDIEPIAAEATVYNRTHKYAGTGDLWARVGAWNNAIAMLDYKTGKSAWPETAYQLAAYRNGEFIGLADGSEHEVPATTAGGVLHVDHGTTHLIPYRCGPREFEVFTHMTAAAYHYVEELDSAMNWAKVVS